MIIIPRKRWGARHAAGFGPAPMASELWLHHSVTPSPGEDATEAQDMASMRRLEDIGQKRFGGGVSYTFAVARSGRVLEGTGGLRKGAHTGGRNSVARAIVLIGDHSQVRPSDVQLQAVADLVRYGRAAGWWSVDRLTGGHRNAPGAATSCPGDAAWACIPLINSRATTAHLAERPTLEDEPMTPEDRDRLARLEAGVQLILQQMVGPGATITEPWPGEQRGGGWDTWRWNAEPSRLTLVDLVRSVDRKLNSAMALENRPNHPDALDDVWGHGLSTHAHVVDIREILERMDKRTGGAA